MDGGAGMPWLTAGFDLSEVLKDETEYCGSEDGTGDMLMCFLCQEESPQSELLVCEHELCGSFYHQICLLSAIVGIKKDHEGVEVFCPSCFERQEGVRKRLLDCGIDVGSDNAMFSLHLHDGTGQRDADKIMSLLHGKFVCHSGDKNREQIAFLRQHLRQKLSSGNTVNNITSKIGK